MAAQRAPTAREVTAMIGLATIKRILKIDQSAYDQSSDAHVSEVRVNLDQLEASQEPLKRAIRDTGFFLGDALVRQPHERVRAVHHDR